MWKLQAIWTYPDTTCDFSDGELTFILKEAHTRLQKYTEEQLTGKKTYFDMGAGKDQTYLTFVSTRQTDPAEMIASLVRHHQDMSAKAFDTLFYAAEDLIEAQCLPEQNPRYNGIKEIDQFVSLVWEKHGGNKPKPIVEISIERAIAHYIKAMNHIIIGFDMTSRWTILHEISHALDSPESKGHGPTFVDILSILVSEYINPALGEKVKTLRNIFGLIVNNNPGPYQTSIIHNIKEPEEY
jgi:hypothetical protein